MAEKSKFNLKLALMFIAIGGVLGAIVMVILGGNVAIGIGIGAASGTAIGSAIGASATQTAAKK